MKLFYPFPVDQYHLYPDSIEVEEMDFTRTRNGVTFVVTLGPHETTQVNVAYRQTVLTNHARYILTTARKWGESISSALFTVTAPEGYELTLSYKPDSVRTENGRTICYIVERDLFPDQELNVWWKKLKN